MAKRSTRNKILHQGKLIEGYIEKIYAAFRYIDELANDNSEHVTTQLPRVAKLTQSWELVIRLFLKNL